MKAKTLYVIIGGIISLIVVGIVSIGLFYFNNVMLVTPTITATPGWGLFPEAPATAYPTEAILSSLSESDQSRLLESMNTIQSLLGSAPERSVPYILRPHQPGDMGWVVQRHGVLYNTEYGWDETFEALVANVVADFINDFDPKRERCWMAEVNGEIVGSVFVVKKSDEVAKLRLLIVDPKARGLGIGKRLVDECIRFARQAGYKKMTLWTNSVLTAARHIYANTGFKLVEEEPHHSFGHDLVSETWERDL